MLALRQDEDSVGKHEAGESCADTPTLPVTKFMPELPLLVAVLSGAATYCIVVGWLWYLLLSWVFRLIWQSL
jgi:hypothetical protein